MSSKEITTPWPGRPSSSRSNWLLTEHQRKEPSAPWIPTTTPSRDSPVRRVSAPRYSSVANGVPSSRVSRQRGSRWVWSRIWPRVSARMRSAPALQSTIRPRGSRINTPVVREPNTARRRASRSEDGPSQGKEASSGGAGNSPRFKGRSETGAPPKAWRCWARRSRCRGPRTGRGLACRTPAGTTPAFPRGFHREGVHVDGVLARAVVRRRKSAGIQGNRAAHGRADATQSSDERHGRSAAVGVDEETRLVVDHAGGVDHEARARAGAGGPCAADQRRAAQAVDLGGAVAHDRGRVGHRQGGPAQDRAALAGVEALRGVAHGLVAQHAPAEILARVVEPELRVGDHAGLGREHVGRRAGHDRRAAGGGREISAWVVQNPVGVNVCSQVASGERAGAPLPPGLAAEGPSPQSARTRRNSMVSLLTWEAWEQDTPRVTPVIVEPAGITLRSKRRSPRRMAPPPPQAHAASEEALPAPFESAPAGSS
jgi:hypothetical protein